MPYSIEQIYLHSGQFDKITSVTFHIGTESQKLYGDFITGEFIYTRQERIELENKIKLEPIPFTSGRVKFADNITKLTDLQRKELLEKGIPSSEIISIGQFREKDENKFIQDSLRELPKPIELKVDFSGIDADNLTLNLTRMRLQSGHKMIQNEKDAHNAVVLKRINPTEKDTDKFKNIFIDPETGLIYEGIRYHLLKEICLGGKASKEQDDELRAILTARLNRRTETVISEIKRSLKNPKKNGAKYSGILQLLFKIALWFDDIRLTHGKFPVWLDFDRYVHIFLRHVKGLQIGELFESRTAFQYAPHQIASLIETVLKQVDKDINEHFESNPTKPFKRHGRMAVYYNGDYYNFHIDVDGRLLTFYKQDEKGEPAS